MEILKLLEDRCGYQKKRIGSLNWSRDSSAYELELAKILQEQDRYEKERKALQCHLKDGNRRILGLQARYAMLSNRKCSILQLPEEITRTIFFCTQEYPNESKLYWLGESGPLPEVVISHVCRQWRSISLAYPFLWTRFGHDAGQSNHVPLDRFEAYLSRSRSKPLELWFDFHVDDHEEIDLEELLALLEMAISHVHRWKYVYVMSDEDFPLWTVSGMLEWASVPWLEYFAFCNNYDSKYPPSLQPAIFKKGAPNLKSVILDTSIGQKLLPPLQNITTLCFECQDTSEVVDQPFPWPTFVVVLSLPFLVNLSIMGKIFEEPALLDLADPITMKNLENLRFGDTGSSFPSILPFLKAPLLQTLFIKNDSLEALGNSQSEPQGFPSLELLVLFETSFNTQAARYLANMTQSVTNITILKKEDDASLFSVFLHSHGEYWPNLKFVHLDIDIGLRLKEVIQCIQARRDSALILQISDDVLNQWQSTNTPFLGLPYTLGELEKICCIKTVNSKYISVPAVWIEHWPTLQWCPDFILKRKSNVAHQF
ncbi:hypothetical protein CPB84DRAFT_781514 [Gymnopilus junonius]|uniref:F-box domain-containing protein n=1 Tax=Gymnopilus junonius TaxID=109634 RepID=A0A9P5NNH8_GYMJU|nr:hypothetical protein CPB84DRAFT_781514 [Gymnopilus junonius]